MFRVRLRKGSSVSLVHPSRFRRVALGGVAATSLLLLTGCSAEQETEIKRLAMPVAASKEAPLIFDLWMGAWLAAILTGLLVWGLIFFVAIRYRRRSETEIPVQTRYNLPIEIFYTIAPIIMVVVFFYFTVDTQNKVLNDDKNPDETITVVGQQWSWTFNYNLGYDEDKQSYEQVGSEQVVHEVGTTADRPTLWLVKDKKVKIYLASPDVVHSFWVPAFLFKLDVVPGRDNNFVVTPSREGTFEGRCAELCGVYHSRMLFNVKVVDQEAYDAHLEELAAQGNTGKATGGEDVDKTAGLEPAEDNGGGE
jgi:cytochrome c oxidase subunit 2